jgi:hypothetical protein
MDTVTLPKALVESILKYLWDRPLSEAYDLFNQLSKAVHDQGQAPPQQKQQQPTGQYLHRDQIMNQ